MKINVINKTILIFSFCFFLNSCTDPYLLKTNNYEEAIVIEATITNEIKHQEIKITKTYRLEENAPTIVSDAIVFVTNNIGNNYSFIEQNGIYVSVDEFQAEPNVEYKLTIITEDGKTYTSSNETLTHVNEIQSVVPTVATKNGIKGVDIIVNSFDPTNSSKYYRYEYEETNKIIAPKWSPYIANVTYTPNPGAPTPGIIDLLERTIEAKTCFSTKKSNSIILTSTNDLTEDRVNYSVRFIDYKNYIIAERYSILVKQYVQNLASYSYYKTLNELSGSESILSQNQPGFFSGNISCLENPNENVIGFFDVSSISLKRIFFNYRDVFQNENIPKYPYNCEIDFENPQQNLFKYCFQFNNPECAGNTVLNVLYSGNYVYYNYSNNYYELYPTPCGDCTSFSSNIIPSFWHD